MSSTLRFAMSAISWKIAQGFPVSASGADFAYYAIPCLDSLATTSASMNIDNTQQAIQREA
jgi:hypothetical protein